jgi:3-oxoacyl-[acyl-carrier-protein] synthase III
MEDNELTGSAIPSFYDRPGVQIEKLPIGPGIRVGIEQAYNPAIGIGGAYGTWGESYDNQDISRLIAQHLGAPLGAEEEMNLAELGFVRRHIIPPLSSQEDIDLEVQVGARFLRQAADACGWEPSEVQAVLLGVGGPVLDDYTEQVAREAGIPDSAVKVSIHKACDGSVAGLNLALNSALPVNRSLDRNLAEELYGKKVLVGGIDGLSRFLKFSHDKNALQLFGNGAGVIGVIPGQTMKLLTSRTYEAFDEEGVLQVKMCYPYTGQHTVEQSLIEVSTVSHNHYRVAGLMHIPDGEEPMVMAGLMGMVKLFVRNGVQVVKDVYQDYQARMTEMGLPGKKFAVAIVHHANLKINRLLEKHLQKEGIFISMPWLLSEFGNVSAASNMIAFLRQLPGLKSGDHILIDGFGAGTYYDVLAVEVG